MAKEEIKEKDQATEKKEIPQKQAEKRFNPEWLKGLTFSYAETKYIEKSGRKTLHATPMTRPLTEADLLAWKEYPDRIVLATKDGKKYAIKKK